MTIEAEFAELMLDEVTVTKPTGSRSLYGNAAMETVSSAFRGRWVRKHRMVRAVSGDEVVSRSHVYVFGTPGIKVEDRVTLPDGSAPPILAVEQYPDENGPHHEVVFFGVGTAGGGRV